MPRYFFDTAGAFPSVDAEGRELDDDDAARLEAVRYAGRWIQARPYLLSDTRDVRVELRTEDRTIIFRVTISATSDAKKSRRVTS